MNYSQEEPGIFSGITGALSSAWEGTKKAVSSVMPAQPAQAYNGQIAGRRKSKTRRHRKARKTHKSVKTNK